MEADVEVVGEEKVAGEDEKPTGDLAAGILQSEAAGGRFDSVVRRVNEETRFFARFSVHFDPEGAVDWFHLGDLLSPSIGDPQRSRGWGASLWL